MHPQPCNESSNGELIVGNIYLQRLYVKPLNIRPQAFLRALLYGQKVITRFPVRPCSDKVGDECDGKFCEQ